jgi:energy-coupling factor transporter ATP-binding protein EcfA2
MENGTNGRAIAGTPSKPKLTRLKIESFRNVAPCELRFGGGFNVLLGLNATGKTTLLELIVAALSFDFSKFANEPFAVEYELTFSTGTIVASVRSERAERPLLSTPLLQVRDTEMFERSAKLHIRFSSPPEVWTVCTDMSSIWIEDRPQRRLALQTHLGDRGPGLLLRALQIDFNESMLLAYQTELSSWARTRRFDEALDLFRDITSPSTWIEVATDRASHAVLGFNFNGVLPAELLVATGAHAVNMPGDSQGLTIPAESLSFLREVGVLFGFKTARLEMRLESKMGGDLQELKFSGFRFMFEDDNGSVKRHDDLSYGQKRLLAFHYYLAASPMTVIADELVDGLHHLWIDASLEAIGDRQAFLASQSPLLLDHLEFDSAEQVASTFITCRTEQSGDEKRMLWSNMSSYDAERFFRAYQVDVQHVSEILLSKGLW